MFPEEVLACDPAILAKSKELSERRICRCCLSEADTLMVIDVVWKMKIVSCFPLVTIGSDKLPNFICVHCGKFVKQCFEFRKLCKKAEQLLVSYPLTGTWADGLAIPRWLHPEQIQAERKRKVIDELEVPQVGRVRVRSHESMAMSLQSPTITPGSVEQTMQAIMVDERPRQEVPTITPTTRETTYAIPVIQSQPSSSQYSPCTLPYNLPSQFSHQATNITPVIQPPQKRQRTSSVQKLPPLLPYPGYTMQHNTPQLVSHLQTPSGNTNLNNMTNMLAQLPNYPEHPQQQQQQHHVQVSFSNVSPNRDGALVNQLKQPTNYSQSQYPSTLTSHQQYQYSSNAVTSTRIQLPPASHQQPPIPMTPTRSHTYYQQQNPPTAQQPQQFSKPVNLWCHVCNFKFLTVDHYDFHTRKHSTSPLGNLTGRLAGRQKTCKLCTAPIFPTQADLVQHLKIHEQVGLTKACDFCVKIFADEERRNEHYRKDHADELRRTLRLNEH